MLLELSYCVEIFFQFSERGYLNEGKTFFSSRSEMFLMKTKGGKLNAEKINKTRMAKF